MRLQNPIYPLQNRSKNGIKAYFKEFRTLTQILQSDPTFLILLGFTCSLTQKLSDVPPYLLPSFAPLLAPSPG